MDSSIIDPLAGLQQLISNDFYGIVAGAVIGGLGAWITSKESLKLVVYISLSLAFSAIFQYAATGVVTFTAVWALAEYTLKTTGLIKMLMLASGVEQELAKTDWRGKPRR